MVIQLQVFFFSEGKKHFCCSHRRIRVHHDPVNLEGGDKIHLASLPTFWGWCDTTWPANCTLQKNHHISHLGEEENHRLKTAFKRGMCSFRSQEAYQFMDDSYINNWTQRLKTSLLRKKKTSNHKGFLPPNFEIWISHTLPARRPRNLRLQGKQPTTHDEVNSKTRRFFKPSVFGPRFALAFRRSFNLNRYTENRKTYNHPPCRVFHKWVIGVRNWKTSHNSFQRCFFQKKSTFRCILRDSQIWAHEIPDTLRFKRDIGSLLADVFHSLHTLLI